MKIEVNTKKDKNYNLLETVRNSLIRNIVTVMFLLLSIVGYMISDLNPTVFLLDIISRISRNTFLVLSLIIPIVAGMGLNFAIVLGAMAAQGVMIYVTHWEVTGLLGILLCFLLTTPIAIILGYLTGRLFNRARGKEMITGLILGFFATGVYQFIFLQLVGPILPLNNERMLLSTGRGVRTTIDLSDGLKYGLDTAWQFPLVIVLLIAGIAGFVYYLYKYKKSDHIVSDKYQLSYGLAVSVGILALSLLLYTSDLPFIENIRVPLGTWLVIFFLCVGINLFINKTKLGQDMRTVGQDQHAAEVSGIDVDRVRIKAIIFSIVLASWGHVIFLQNLGAFSTYGSHEQIGLYSSAAILIGGATVAKATIGQAILGVILFHTLFIVSPSAGRVLFGDAQIGEYFRVFVAYGVIGIALAMHAWKQMVQDKYDKLKSQ